MYIYIYPNAFGKHPPPRLGRRSLFLDCIAIFSGHFWIPKKWGERSRFFFWCILTFSLAAPPKRDDLVSFWCRFDVFLAPAGALERLLDAIGPQRRKSKKKSPPGANSRTQLAPIWVSLRSHFGALFRKIRNKMPQKACPGKKLRKSDPTGWAHMQSVHAGAVQTHFSKFPKVSKMTSKRLPFGRHFDPMGRQMCIFIRFLPSCFGSRFLNA